MVDWLSSFRSLKLFKLVLTKMTIDPLHSEAQHWCQRTFFSIGLFLLKFWRIFSGKVRNMVKPLFEHFQFYQKWAIFERFEKKVSKIGWNHIYKVYVTQMHHDTRFLTTFLLKNAPILVKICNFLFFKNPHFWLFSGILDVKLKFQDRSFDIYDHNKCPSSEK